MNRQFSVLTGLALILFSVLSGCASVPTQQPSWSSSPINQVPVPARGVVPQNMAKSIGATPTHPTQTHTGTNVNPGGAMLPAELSLAKQHAESLTGAAFITDRVGFVSSKHVIYKTTDGGHTWAQIYDSKDSILGIAAKYQPQVKAEYVVAYTKTYLIRSQDGRYFKKQSIAGDGNPGSGADIQGLSLLSNNTIYLLNNKAVWQTNPENGRLYRASPTNTVSSISATWNANGAAVCYAVSGKSVYRTTDSEHWTRVFTAPIGGSQNWNSRVYANGGHVAVLFRGEVGMSQQAYILFDSNDAGKTWQPMVDEAYFGSDYKHVKPLARTDAGEQPGPFTVDSEGHIFITGMDINNVITILTELSPKGRVIIRVPVEPSANSPNAFTWLPSAVSTPDGKNVYVVGGKSGQAVVEKSTDGGLLYEAK